MKHQKILALWLLLFVPLVAMAKNDAATYVVSKVSGRVEQVTQKGKRQLEKGDVLTADMLLDVSFSGSLTLLAEGGDKQYVINAPGKAKLESFLADKRNTVLSLSKDYVKSLVTQLRRDKTVKARKWSDPATVTRELLVKDSLMVVKTDSTQCCHKKTSEL